jgi:hypothetical protein
MIPSTSLDSLLTSFSTIRPSINSMAELFGIASKSSGV